MCVCVCVCVCVVLDSNPYAQEITWGYQIFSLIAFTAWRKDWGRWRQEESSETWGTVGLIYTLENKKEALSPTGRKQDQTPGIVF